MIALRDRLAEGSLRAHCSAYTFVNRFADGTERHIALENGCIPTQAWLIFARVYDHWREDDWKIGDFSFDAKFDQEHYVFSARDVTFHVGGLPALAIARRKALARQAISTIDAPLPRGRRAKWPWEQALSFLAAHAHLNPDGLLLPDGEDPNQSDIAKVLQQWFLARYDDSPSDAELRKRGKLVLDEIKNLNGKDFFAGVRPR